MHVLQTHASGITRVWVCAPASRHLSPASVSPHSSLFMQVCECVYVFIYYYCISACQLTVKQQQNYIEQKRDEQFQLHGKKKTTILLFPFQLAYKNNNKTTEIKTMRASESCSNSSKWRSAAKASTGLTESLTLDARSSDIFVSPKKYNRKRLTQSVSTSFKCQETSLFSTYICDSPHAAFSMHGKSDWLKQN